jgi:translation elongation factor aEF-1 beta
MAEVLVALRVMPKSVDVDLNILEKKIKESVLPDRIEKTPIAFGIVAFNVMKFVPDDAKALEDIESKLKTIDEVGEVEVIEVMRSL